VRWPPTDRRSWSSVGSSPRRLDALDASDGTPVVDVEPRLGPIDER
jgi:tRNA (Thr-GGU) A37 N-methylase